LRTLLDYGVTVVLLGLLLLVAARLERANMRDERGTAVIADGDSITLGATRIRLRGIDAPEYAQTCQKDGIDYACGKRAREALAAMTAGRAVSCAGSQHDRYGRLLGNCTAGGVDLNRAQVQAGWAVAYGAFESEETAARAAKVGIWAGTFERPQEWRQRHGAKTEPKHDDFLAWAGDRVRQALRFW
jgi:endonuclease YncB( thermonuclease family)